MLKTTTKERTLQNVIGLAILIVVGLICWPLAPKPNSNVSGILLPTAPLKAAITPDQVQILQAMPPHAQNLGIINTKIYYATLAPSEQNQDMSKSLDYTKVLAAKAGANAVIVNAYQSGYTPQGPLDGFVIQANAVSL